MTNGEAIYRDLLESPGDAAKMRLLADALEEEGYGQLAAAYRWAAERGKWPLDRSVRPQNGMDSPAMRRVYDWDREGRSPAPESSWLPRDLFDHMRLRLSGRRYGGVNQAFMLLANVLAGNESYEPLGPPWAIEL